MTRTRARVVRSQQPTMTDAAPPANSGDSAAEDSPEALSLLERIAKRMHDMEIPHELQAERKRRKRASRSRA